MPILSDSENEDPDTGIMSKCLEQFNTTTVYLKIICTANYTTLVCFSFSDCYPAVGRPLQECPDTLLSANNL